jgi:copper oxidase (laccase) domain-containing protein
VKSGLRVEHIEVSPHCTICSPALFHSYRRDGKKSGRMLAVIGMH